MYTVLFDVFGFFGFKLANFAIALKSMHIIPYIVPFDPKMVITCRYMKTGSVFKDAIIEN